MKICPKCNNKHEKPGNFCCRSCANSRIWNEEDKKKKSISVKKFIEENGHPGIGKLGWKHTDEQRELKRQLSLKSWDKRGRKSVEHRRIKNIVGVNKYRARKYNAITDDSNLRLINEIYKNCPDGYEVDHIVALINGGLHHQDNLQYLPGLENKKKNKYDNYDKNLVIRWQDVIREKEYSGEAN